MTDTEELAKTIEKIHKATEHRAQLVQHRDRQIVALHAAGATWKQLRQITGLSTRGVDLALKRARSEGVSDALARR